MKDGECELCGGANATPRETRTWRHGALSGWQAISSALMTMCGECAARWTEIDAQCARNDPPHAILPMPLTARILHQQRKRGLA